MGADNISSCGRKDKGLQGASIFCNGTLKCSSVIRGLFGIRSSAQEILDFIQSTYGVKDSVIVLQLSFYSRQKVSQSMRDYMRALMELLNGIITKDKSFQKEKSQMVKFKFADCVQNISLHHELNRLNDERHSLSTAELHHHAEDWG